MSTNNKSLNSANTINIQSREGNSMTQLSKKQQQEIQKQLKDAREFTREKLERTVGKEATAIQLAKSLPSGFVTKVKLAAGLLKDYAKGNYREIPWNTIACLGAGIAYLASPLDAVPDFIPVAGLADDALLLTLVFKGVSADLDDYAAWRERQKEKSGPGASGRLAA